MDEKRMIRGGEHTQTQSLDGKGPGGARHAYVVDPTNGTQGMGVFAHVSFQSGPIAEAGVNGCQNEDLLAIVVDRLSAFQAGEFACRENAIALTHIETALMWLEQRTRDRQARGVEGRNER